MCRLRVYLINILIKEVDYDNAGRNVKKLKIKNKFREMAKVYLSFSLIKRCESVSEEMIKIWDEYDSYRDYSEEALEEFYINESHGKEFTIIRSNGKINAYIEGQKWFNLTKTEYWKPDIKSGELKKEELYESDIPHWFLDKVLKDVE